MGRKKKKQTTTSKTEIPAWAQKQAESLGNKVQGAANRGDLAKVAGFTADQQQAHDITRDLTGAAGQIGQDAANAQRAAATGTGLFGKQSFDKQTFDPTSVNLDAYAGEAANLLAGKLGQIGAGADARGTSGGARAQKAAQAAQAEAAAGLAAKQADLVHGDEQQLRQLQAQETQQLRQLDQADLAARRSAQQGSINQAGAAQNALYKPAEQLGKIGADQQALQQKQADQEYTNLKRQGELLNAAVGKQVTQTQTAPSQGK